MHDILRRVLRGVLAVVATVATTGEAATPAATAAPAQIRQQAPLFFREEWQRTPGPVQHPVVQGNVATPTLELKLYGPSGKLIEFLGGPGIIPVNPAHVWTGMCEQTCALALRDKNNYVDLSGFGKVIWFVRTSGLHRVHPIVKLADGTWLLGERESGTNYDMHPDGFTLSESRWIQLDIDRVVTRGRWLEKPDLSKVDEIGFTDLMPSSGHGEGGYLSMGWIEVYGRPVPRAGK